MDGVDVQRITARDVIDDIARSLDPLAFENPDRTDMEKRRRFVYMRITEAYRECHRRETGYDHYSPFPQDADIPW